MREHFPTSSPLLDLAKSLTIQIEMAEWPVMSAKSLSSSASGAFSLCPAPAPSGIFSRRNNHGGLVDILLVRSKEPAAFYSYNGRTAGKCIQEIREFSRDSSPPPDKERRQQTFIVSRLLYNAGNNDHSHLAEVPFFGFGKNCFALDYADFTLKHLGSIRPQERLLTKSYGELCLQAGEWTQPPHNDLPPP